MRYYLAAAHALFGESGYGVILFQQLLRGATGILVLRLMRRLAAPAWTGWAAAGYLPFGRYLGLAGFADPDLCDARPAKRLVQSPFHLIVQDARCLVQINGETVCEYDRLDNLDEGRIELQAHRPGYWTEFKQIRIKRL